MNITLDNVFEKIVAGELPCFKVYEDARVLAFLDLNPLCVGHTLVIPKKKSVTLADLPEEDAAALGAALPKIARALIQAVGTSDYNLLQNNGPSANQVVRHVHFHLIPKHADGSGLPFQWPKTQLDKAQGEVLATRIRAALS